MLWILISLRGGKTPIDFSSRLVIFFFLNLCSYYVCGSNLLLKTSRQLGARPETLQRLCVCVCFFFKQIYRKLTNQRLYILFSVLQGDIIDYDIITGMKCSKFFTSTSTYIVCFYYYLNVNKIRVETVILMDPLIILSWKIFFFY